MCCMAGADRGVTCAGGCTDARLATAQEWLMRPAAISVASQKNGAESTNSMGRESRLNPMRGAGLLGCGRMANASFGRPARLS